VHTEPVDKRTGGSQPPAEEERPAARSRRSRGGKAKAATEDAGPDAAAQAAEADKRRAAASAIAAIAAATSHHDGLPDGIEGGDGVGSDGISPARDSGSGGDTDGGPDSHSDADGQAVVQRSDEGEFHPSPTDATVVTEPVAEPSPAPAPEAVPDGDELEIADYPADPYAPSVAAARPRRRRGASRPAGPPVGLSTATTGA
jgi:ribonuclease E